MYRLLSTASVACLLLASSIGAQPQLLHSRIYDSGVDDEASRHCIAIDANTVYAAGTIRSNTDRDLVLWALDLTGTTLWSRVIGGAGDQSASGVALDGAGGVYVAGTGYGFGASSDYIVARYDSTGNQVWIRNFDRGGSDIVGGMAADGAGKVVLTGRSHAADQDALTVAWDSSGGLLWSAVYSGGVHLTFDSAGNTYMAGSMRPSVSAKDRCVTACYNSSGNEVWSDVYGSSGQCSPSRVLVDSSGNCFVSLTQRYGVSTQQLAVALKYDSTGTLLWNAPYSVGDPAGGDRAESMVLNPAGGVFLGVESFSGTDWDVHALAVNSTTPSLITVYDSGVNDEVEDLLLDGQGNLMIAGRNVGSAQGDGLFIAINPGGWTEWVATFSAGSGEYFRGVAESAAGDIALYGERQGTTDVDFLVARFRENQAPVASPSTVWAYEDWPASIQLVGTDVDNDPLTYVVLTQPVSGNISGTGPNITYNPAPDFKGQVSFLFEVHDPSSTSVAARVTINVLPRNDPPTFAAQSGASMSEGVSSVAVFAAFASGMSPGPADEASQSLQFVVTGNTNPALFTMPPQIDAMTGDLAFSVVGTAGTSLVTLVLVDDGGTANGGADTSAPRSFLVRVGDPPKEDSNDESSCSSAAAKGWHLLFVLMAALAGLAMRRPDAE